MMLDGSAHAHSYETDSDTNVVCVSQINFRLAGFHMFWGFFCTCKNLICLNVTLVVMLNKQLVNIIC